MQPTVYFAHGKESGPWGKKITALAAVAEAQAWTVHSPDYQGIDDPHERINKLCSLKPQGRPLVLVGSSMGGYVSAFAAEQLKPAGLFLMAPALYMPFAGYDGEPRLTVPEITVLHGWRDEVIPVTNGIRFAKQHKANLEIWDDDHLLSADLARLSRLFNAFLSRVKTE